MNKKEPIKVHVVAGVVVERDDKYLLVQEKKQVAYGKWNLPAGKVEGDDTFEQTAIREAKEETGLDVSIVRKIGVFHNNGEGAVKHAFEARITGGTLQKQVDEVLDAKWFTYSEILAMKDNLRDAWVLEAITIVNDKK